MFFSDHFDVHFDDNDHFDDDFDDNDDLLLPQAVGGGTLDKWKKEKKDGGEKSKRSFRRHFPSWGFDRGE